MEEFFIVTQPGYSSGIKSTTIRSFKTIKSVLCFLYGEWLNGYGKKLNVAEEDQEYEFGLSLDKWVGYNIYRCTLDNPNEFARKIGKKELIQIWNSREEI